MSNNNNNKQNNMSNAAATQPASLATCPGLTDEERKARRAQQSRECRARKAQGITAPSAGARNSSTAEARDSSIVAALKAASKDIKSYVPDIKGKKIGPVLDTEDKMLVMLVNDVPEYDIDVLRANFKAWAADKAWHSDMTLYLTEETRPNHELPTVAFYIAANS